MQYPVHNWKTFFAIYLIDQSVIWCWSTNLAHIHGEFSFPYFVRATLSPLFCFFGVLDISLLDLGSESAAMSYDLLAVCVSTGAMRRFRVSRLSDTTKAYPGIHLRNAALVFPFIAIAFVRKRETAVHHVFDILSLLLDMDSSHARHNLLEHLRACLT